MQIPFVYISKIEPVLFGYELKQSSAMDWLIDMHSFSSQNCRESRFVDFYERLKKSCKIDFRRTCLSDYTHSNRDDYKLFRPMEFGGSVSPMMGPPLQKRMEIYSEVSADIANQAYSKDNDPPAYFIKTSCTGYESPNALQKLVDHKNWHGRSRLLEIGHMGCYASIPVVSMGGYLLNGYRQVPMQLPGGLSILFVELCTLHFRPFTESLAQAVINTLFGDGAVRVDLSLDKEKALLGVIDSFETIIPDTIKEMEWTVADQAFHMTLSSKISESIVTCIKPEVSNFLEKHNLTWDDIGQFAIHPGGPRIIDQVADCLELPEQKIAHSRSVLLKHGNMSSCTIPTIWHEILMDKNIADGVLILSLAFGPGLTLAGSLLRKESSTCKPL